MWKKKIKLSKLRHEKSIMDAKHNWSTLWVTMVTAWWPPGGGGITRVIDFNSAWQIWAEPEHSPIVYSSQVSNNERSRMTSIMMSPFY